MVIEVFQDVRDKDKAKAKQFLKHIQISTFDI